MKSHLLLVLSLVCLPSALRAQDGVEEQIDRVFNFIETGEPVEAVKLADEVIASFEAIYNEPGTIYVCGEGGDGIFNMILASAAAPKSVLVSNAFCVVYYLKGYALMDLHQGILAEPALRRATEMDPSNAHYLNEYAELFKSRLEWQKSNDLFVHAWEIVDRDKEGPDAKFAARALRGMGYTKIELGELDEAERLFKLSQEYDPDSEGAKAELKYIARKKAIGQ